MGWVEEWLRRSFYRLKLGSAEGAEEYRLDQEFRQRNREYEPPERPKASPDEGLSDEELIARNRVRLLFREFASYRMKSFDQGMLADKLKEDRQQLEGLVTDLRQKRESADADDLEILHFQISIAEHDLVIITDSITEAIKQAESAQAVCDKIEHGVQEAITEYRVRFGLLTDS